MSVFSLHPRLEADTVPVASLGLCRVLLARDSRFPWLILVPEKPSLRDLHDLGRSDRNTAMDEIDTASRILMALHSADKINVAALGNMVPQLHIHVIARFTDDAAWPAPVWGIGSPEPYDDDSLDKALITLQNAFA